VAAALWGRALRQEYARDQAFELFNRWDLRQRIAFADTAGADLFLSLHYNMVDGMGQNGIIVFVPGNFMQGELETDSQRYYATRLLASGVLREAVRLGRAIGLELQRAMQLPPIGEPRPTPDGAAPNRVLVDAAAALFARNLGVLRRAPMPALLLEGPCMNDPHEYARLTTMVGTIDGLAYPDRAVQYADAVVAALEATSAGH
jgi:hypothetical protein